jgi:hypothetical protein
MFAVDTFGYPAVLRCDEPGPCPECDARGTREYFSDFAHVEFERQEDDARGRAVYRAVRVDALDGEAAPWPRYQA